MKTEQVNQAFEYAKTRYAGLGIDVEKVIVEMDKLSISLHCWQADDVTGFESGNDELTGGIQVTGNYPGNYLQAPRRHGCTRRSPTVAGYHYRWRFAQDAATRR